jgi:hypothetical protein
MEENKVIGSAITKARFTVQTSQSESWSLDPRDTQVQEVLQLLLDWRLSVVVFFVFFFNLLNFFFKK